MNNLLLSWLVGMEQEFDGPDPGGKEEMKILNGTIPSSSCSKFLQGHLFQTV
jgi:hypothetical protein